MAATPQLPRVDFVAWMRKIESAIAFIHERLNNVLANTGLSIPSPGVTQVDGSLIVQNGEAKSGNYAAGSAGWHLDHDGNAEFNDLTLRGGIIGNDALTSPVTAAFAHASGDSFALATGSNVSKATATVTVPSGFTRALVQAFAAISAWNPTASTDTLYLGCRINNPSGVDQNAGWSMSHTVPASTQGSISESSTALMTGLTAGQTFTVQTTASSGAAAWSASSSNVANIDATIIWLR